MCVYTHKFDQFWARFGCISSVFMPVWKSYNYFSHLFPSSFFHDSKLGVKFRTREYEHFIHRILNSMKLWIFLYSRTRAIIFRCECLYIFKFNKKWPLGFNRLIDRNCVEYTNAFVSILLPFSVQSNNFHDHFKL